jgi:hypothetical protein
MTSTRQRRSGEWVATVTTTGVVLALAAVTVLA